MPTFRDLAKRAGLSTATVSATINGTAFVSPALQQRVQAVVRELGYAPDAIAGSLGQGRPHLIGLVCGAPPPPPVHRAMEPALIVRGSCSSEAVGSAGDHGAASRF